jgi:RNA polymerase sigma-70 factor (ECF subfamily)
VDTDDAALVRRCLAGDETSCEALVTAHARMVGSVIWRATGDADAVDDLAQETFLRVFRALPHFDRRARLSTWIYTVAHHVAIDHLRKRGRNVDEATLVDDEGDNVLDRLPAEAVLDPEETLASRQLTGLVRAAVAMLPEKYRLPLVYIAIDGLDYDTVAKMLGAPVGTIKTLVFRGKQMLRKQLAPAMGKRTDRVGASDAV